MMLNLAEVKLHWFRVVVCDGNFRYVEPKFQISLSIPYRQGEIGASSGVNDRLTRSSNPKKDYQFHWIDNV